MDRETFLAQPDVEGFIAWLQVELPRLDVHLNFLSSRFVKGGLNKRVVGIEQVHMQYRWGSDWTGTKRHLDLLRNNLRAALAAKCDSKAYLACLAVLQWGGVSGAIPFLHRLRSKGKLVEYLTDCIPLFALNGNQYLSDLNTRSIQHFDAGMTKIHALLDPTGSPIYDSRVGAAIAMLYAMYRVGRQPPALLVFPSGAARGKQIRDPAAFGFAHSPQFHTREVTKEEWARSQLELGWIIQATLAGNSMFEGTLAERCHCLEAALFMIGYDLRCLVPSLVNPPAMPSPRRRRARNTWVPTSVAFARVLQNYLRRSELAGHAVDLRTFKEWQVESGQYKESTATSNCAPLRTGELDLVNFSLEELRRIVEGGAGGLATLCCGNERFIVGDEYEQVYLTTVHLSARVCDVARAHSVQPAQVLVQAGFAGNPETANLIIRMGRAVGSHFGLLEEGQPGPAFSTFFSDSLEKDLEQPLMNAAKVVQSMVPTLP